MTQEEKKSTVGEESYKRLVSGESQEVGETSAEMNKTFEEELMECVTTYRRNRLDDSSPFYVVVLHKKERIMKNVVRRYFFGRESEPTPDYDQVVFKVDPKNMKIDFKWVIPDIETYHDMIFNGQMYPADKQQLVSFCREMNAGTLADYQKVEAVV